MNRKAKTPKRLNAHLRSLFVIKMLAKKGENLIKHKKGNEFKMQRGDIIGVEIGGAGSGG